MSWCDFVNAATHRNDRRDELRHALRVEVRERYLIALVVDASVLRQALLHALGERADAVVDPIGQSNRLQGCLYLVLPARARQRRELAVQGEHLSCGQPGLVAKELWQVADPAPRAKVSDRPAEQGALP